MVETTLSGLEGERVRYDDRTWELTGTVDVLSTGNHLEVEAEQVDDVRGRTVRLQFSPGDPPASLNPGNLGESFERLELEDDGYRLVIETGDRTYRYRLNSIEYA